MIHGAIETTTKHFNAVDLSVYRDIDILKRATVHVLLKELKSVQCIVRKNASFYDYIGNYFPTWR